MPVPDPGRDPPRRAARDRQSPRAAKQSGKVNSIGGGVSSVARRRIADARIKRDRLSDIGAEPIQVQKFTILRPKRSGGGHNRILELKRA